MADYGNHNMPHIYPNIVRKTIYCGLSICADEVEHKITQICIFSRLNTF